MKPTGAIRLQAGKEKPVRNRHPWIFSGAIARLEGRPADGDIVDVLDQRGGFLARGYYNQHSQIRVRLLTWQAGQEITPDFFRELMARAISARQPLAAETTACRLVHAESDLLPGLIVDRYADYLTSCSP